MVWRRRSIVGNAVLLAQMAMSTPVCRNYRRRGRQKRRIRLELDKLVRPRKENRKARIVASRRQIDPRALARRSKQNLGRTRFIRTRRCQSSSAAVKGARR